MRERADKSIYLKIGIVIGIIAVVIAAFCLLRAWENNHGNIDVSREDDVVTYNGKEYRLKDNLETFLILGLDRFEDSSSAASHDSGVQTDFLMLLVLDKDTRQCTAIQINRDTMTKVNKLAVGGTSIVDSYTCQIALAHNYVNDDNEKIRCRNTKDSVEYLLNGIKVNHYLAVTMDVVPVLCDFLGGVEVTVLDDFTGIDDTLVEGETVLLRGETALTYVRARYGMEDSTNSARMARQQQFINALYTKLDACLNADDDFAANLAETVDDYIVYDSSDDKMLKYAEKLDAYEYLGVREIAGEYVRGDEYMEFYPDEEAKKALIMDVFYTPVDSAK